LTINLEFYIKVLIESGLISARKEDQWTYFSINKAAWQAYLKAIDREIRT